MDLHRACKVQKGGENTKPGIISTETRIFECMCIFGKCGGRGWKHTHTPVHTQTHVREKENKTKLV